MIGPEHGDVHISGHAKEASQSRKIDFLKTGKLINKTNIGLNAVSLAIETGKVAIVQGKEHSHLSMQNLNCICVPIVHNSAIKAYFNISFEQQHEFEWALPLIIKLAENISKIWTDDNSEGKDIIDSQFLDEYGLSLREKDVALLWYSNKSALFISQRLGIAEGTVRNIVKRIYLKLNINDRSTLIHMVNTWENRKQH